MTPHTHGDGTVAARLALIHDAVGKQAMQLKEVLMPDFLLLGILFDIAQPGEGVQHLAARPPVRRRQFATFLKYSHLLQG